MYAMFIYTYVYIYIQTLSSWVIYTAKRRILGVELGMIVVWRPVIFAGAVIFPQQILVYYV